MTMTMTLETKLQRELLKSAVMRAIFCPYTGKVLDVRRAVLIDGTDNGGRMFVMAADAYDLLPDDLADRLGYQFDVLDGRKLYGGRK